MAPVSDDLVLRLDFEHLLSVLECDHENEVETYASIWLVPPFEGEREVKYISHNAIPQNTNSIELDPYAFVEDYPRYPLPHEVNELSRETVASVEETNDVELNKEQKSQIWQETHGVFMDVWAGEARRYLKEKVEISLNYEESVTVPVEYEFPGEEGFQMLSIDGSGTHAADYI